VGDNGEKGTRRPTRQAFALLPVANGLNGDTEPACEFELRQARAAAKIANRGSSFRRRDRGRRRCDGIRPGWCEDWRWSERKFLPIAQFDDPSVRFQPQALHARLDFKTRSRPQNRNRLFASQIVGDAR
jgi:hypothetical protein